MKDSDPPRDDDREAGGADDDDAPADAAARDTTASHEGIARVVAAVVAVGLAALTIPETTDFALDDAWIHLSYAKSVRLGDGLSYNPGDWETGASSPLWVLLLAVWPLPDEPVLSVKLLGALLHGVTAWFSTQLALDFVRARATVEQPLPGLSLALLAGILAATTPTLLEGATSGMEVPLTAALVTAFAAALLAGRAVTAGLLAAASVWARPECLGFVVALGVGHVVLARVLGTRRPRLAPAAASVLGGAAALGAWVVYSLVVSGRPWPNTQTIKGSGGGLDGLQYLTAQVLPLQPWLVSLTGVLLLGLALRRDLVQRRPELTALVVATVATLVAIAVSRPLHPGTQFYESRYFAPFAGLWAVVIPFGLLGLRRVLVAVVLAPLAVVTGLQVSEAREALQRHCDDTARVHTAVARHVASQLPPDAVVAVEGAGAIRFFAPRTMWIVDLVGLNDGTAAQLHHDRKAKLCHFVRLDPGYMELPADWIPLFTPVFALRPLARFDDPEYTQVEPTRPLTVFLTEVDEVHPAWRQRCAQD